MYTSELLRAEAAVQEARIQLAYAMETGGETDKAEEMLAQLETAYRAALNVAVNRRGTPALAQVALSVDEVKEIKVTLSAHLRHAVTKLCCVKSSQDDLFVTVHMNQMRLLSKHEGQRPLKSWKVQEIIGCLAENPCKTYENMQLYHMDNTVLPQDINVEKLRLPDHRQATSQKFGVGGGGHFAAAWLKIKEDLAELRTTVLETNPKFELRNCQVDFFIFVFSMCV